MGFNRRLSTLLCMATTAATSACGGASPPEPPEGVFCEDIAAGSIETRTRYAQESVSAGEDCNAERQTRTCGEDGEWSEWSGTALSETCQQLCDDTVVGERQAKVFFREASPVAGQECESRTQERVCTDEGWSPWDGEFTATACQQGCRLEDDSKVEIGSLRERKRFRDDVVSGDGACEAEVQTSVCDADGQWSQWTNSDSEPLFTHEQCTRTLLTIVECEDGDTEERNAYKTDTVDYGEDCQVEQQARICQEGHWSAWQGEAGFEKPSCAPTPYRECDDEDATRTRERYLAEEVELGEECEPVVEEMRCENGRWSKWRSEQAEPTFARCAVRCAEGDEGSVVRYENARVAYGERCVQEEQKRFCNADGWGEYDGIFVAKECVVAPASACVVGDVIVPHGTYATRRFFVTEEIAFGELCQGVEKQALCENGELKVWEGPDSHAFENCVTKAPAACALGEGEGELTHGATLNRVRFRSIEVAWDGECESEVQTQTCGNGTLTPWTGSFEADECAPREPRSCTVQVEGKVVEVDHLGLLERIRYREEVPSFGQKCSGARQSVMCIDGTLGDWSADGEFSATVCTEKTVPDHCEGGAHGDIQEQTVYRQEETLCHEAVQSRTCADGQWGDWSAVEGFSTTPCELPDAEEAAAASR